MKQYFLIFLLSLVLTTVTGCGQKTVFVSGTVTYQGKPASDIAVCFEHDSNSTDPGPAAIGKTDQAGKYTLRLMNHSKKAGVLPGQYRVFLRWVDPNMDRTSNDDKPKQNPSPYPNALSVYQGEGVLKIVPNSERNFTFDFQLDKID
ncbi:MAG: hypothetical protein LBK82_01830 [Planctomycetaceae bacterium]|jgi:hypothetical protein|nr:hypothetical protein [Planctomycetaceae bacterium]